jgi:hypothetical protein
MSGFTLKVARSSRLHRRGLWLSTSTRHVARGDSGEQLPARSEMALATVLFAAMCVVVLVRSPQLLEPDDYAYRASIIALSHGHVLLTSAQYFALKARLSMRGGPGIEQWVHLRGGWISQKNPGYPFFAVPFQWLHGLRVAPLFYGAFGCVGLFCGARAWLGRGGGVSCVALYCFSGAALLFAWRATISTFTDASLIAGATGLLLGVLLRRSDPPARRFTLGLLAFLALDGAVFIRYSDLVVLLVAVVAVLCVARSARLTWPMVVGWCGVVAVFGVFDLVLNHFLYGGVFTTGYRSGIVTFRATALWPNLERMPSRLVESMPAAVLALGALFWIGGRFVARRRVGPSFRGSTRRDALVALVLAVGWFALWALYGTYTWTVGQTLGPGNPIHVVRFYVPVLGLITLLGAWLLTRLPRWATVALVAVIMGLALWSYVTPANDLVVRHPPVERASPSRSVTALPVVGSTRPSLKREARSNR